MNEQLRVEMDEFFVKWYHCLMQQMGMSALENAKHLIVKF